MYKTFCYLIISLALLISCKGQNSETVAPYKFTNSLIKETSPYLLQHAHNPVDWHAWNPATLEKAKKENKLILISIGYAACHWCHVMEHESFENEEVAKIMNENFINIKIDREERPDIDQVYMNAVQLMTGSGGWPLNCIALPNGKPFWGGTYFPKENWTSALTQIATLYKTDPEKIIEFSEKLTQGIQESELISLNSNQPSFKQEDIDKTISIWSASFDEVNGGMNRSPKFPMPNNYQFLLRHAVQTKNKTLKKYVFNTLDKIALGGIFDPINGGFSRYSTDNKWHIPHFEKMLYDNAQLVSLYSDAYLVTKKEVYKETVVKTLAFVERELTNEQGAFYSSLDADSRNKEQHLEEGAYYVWTKEELQQLITTDFELFSAYYNINDYGHWEADKYHLIRKQDDLDFAQSQHIDLNLLKKKVKKWNAILFKARSKKPRPRLDNKTLTSWNALMLKAYVDAYRVFNKDAYLQTALTNALFIKNNQLRKDGGLNHNYKNGASTINAHLMDYATVIEAYIALYEVTLDSQWLDVSEQLAEYCFAHFYDGALKMFYFTSDTDSNLIARKMEITDNVIPASNSILANGLFKLGHYFDNARYKNTSISMLNNVKEQIPSYGSGYSNWLNLYSNLSTDFYEVAIVGKHAKSRIQELNQHYIPNKLIVGSTQPNNAPLLMNRFVPGRTLMYVCKKGACKLPTDKIEQVLLQME